MAKVTTNRAVQTSCKNTKVRTAAGACAPERKPMMKKGGSTKSFPDLNKDGKVTRADILIGKKVIPKAQAGISKGTPFQGYMKTPGAVASDTIAKRDDINTLKKAPNKPGLDKAFRKTYGDDYVGRQSPGIYSKSAKEADAYDRKMGPMKKGGTVHPGFKSVQSSIAAKQGISKEAAGAILAASTRKASVKAKKKNPRLKKVK